MYVYYFFIIQKYLKKQKFLFLKIICFYNFFLSQLTPVHPSGHWQIYEAIPSIQVPPLFKHGADSLDAHSSMFIAQLVPSKPGAQVQVWPFTPSMQVPPFIHGADAQSSMLFSQLAPSKPGGQVQVWPFTPSMQVPPC